MSFTMINKRKALMLLYKFEESLGQYVIKQKPMTESFPVNTVSNIIERDNNIDKSNIEELLEATYLDEVFQFALAITEDTSTYKYIHELMMMFKEYDVYKIRNILAHPNRPFRDEYWYKLAVIASSSLIEIIGLDGIKETLLSAEKGTIEDPPEDWLEEVKDSIIPNNLPKKFEHSITGLLGRTSEEKELLIRLENLRISTIGVVASGGIGKTALVLDLLHKLVLRADTADWCDGIIYIDMKIEKLTSVGIEKLEAIKTIDEIEKHIINEINNIFDESFENLASIFEKYKEKKLLIFIDNLETLIRDNAELFEQFNYSLPRDWRLLVTSRITISSASIISLDALNSKSSIHLARTYVSKSGEEALTTENYKDIVKSCHYNPLAIRLTLDLYISGNELPKSIAQSTKMIANFSFENLIDKLSENSVKILEVLFIDSNIDRFKLGLLLNLTLDEITESIHELSKTSLIRRNNKNNMEFFNLSSSIQELLLSSPRNIEIRGQIQEQINQNKISSMEIDKRQKTEGVNEYNLKYIPSDIDSHLKILINRLNGSFNEYKLKRNVSELYRDFVSVKNNYENDYMYHRSIGRLFYGLRDIDNAIKSYNKAIDLNILDYMSKFLLAKAYFYDKKDYAEAEKNYFEIIKSKVIGQNDWFAKSVLTGYFLSLLYQDKYETVLEYTKKWEDSNEISKGILGTYRASAWRRKLENIASKDTNDFAKTIEKSINVFDTVFNEVGYLDSTCIQVIKLFDVIESSITRKEFNEIDKKKWLDFIAKHIIAISTHYHKLDVDYTNNLISKFIQLKIKNNIFQNQKWLDFIKHDFKDAISEEYAIQNAYMLVRIINIPKNNYDFPSYVFARNKDDESFLVHFSTLMSKDWNDWLSIQVDMVLAIKAEYSDDGKHKSIETQFVN